MRTRADRHNNPAAFTVAVARQAGLVEGTDYAAGDLFPHSLTLRTARLLKDPIETTIRVIDLIGFYTQNGRPRWDYIAIPRYLWDQQDKVGKVRLIRWMYQRETGTELDPLFREALGEEG